MNKLIPLILHLIPLIPLKRSICDPDRRFYIFVEQPLIGLLTTPISLLAAVFITGDNPIFGSLFVINVIEVYFAYQLANIVRDGVNTDPQIKGFYKLFLNWFYSCVSYILFTAAGKLASAHTVEEKTFAYSLVLFSLIWPLFSQTTNTLIWTPLLFSHFPRKSLLDQLKDPSLTYKKILNNNVHNRVWINWFRKDVVTKHQIRRKFLLYWGFKTSVGVLIAILMTTIYFLARWSLVGHYPSEQTPLQMIMRLFMPE